MADSPEESTWTFYIQGFICDNNNNHHHHHHHHDDDNISSFSSEFVSPSLVSDAASSAVAKKLKLPKDLGFPSPKNKTLSKQTSFKKQKTTIVPAMDHDLEDTASSPVNSPKVSYMDEFMNHEKKEKAKMDVSEVRRNSIGKVFAVGERDSNYVDLKKRSTCG